MNNKFLILGVIVVAIFTSSSTPETVNLDMSRTYDAISTLGSSISI
ncbi:MAG: hypothetical protein OEY17_04640 [Nitrosopumilus sp.]|nr:hypothetical protein [Nitrosopumilus sp.]